MSPLPPSFLRSLPKCEHHIHIEGALTPSVLFTLAHKHNLPLPDDDPAFTSPTTLTQRYTQFTSLDDFLHYYRIATNYLIDEQDWYQLTYDYLTHAAADGVVHAEIFFEPQYPSERGIHYQTLFRGFRKAQNQAQVEWGVSSVLIACYSRHRDPADVLGHVSREEVGRVYREFGVEGVGLGSSEVPFPPKLFREVYDVAGRMGLRRTAHAGEEGPAEYVVSALDDLGVTRVDHGIRAGVDPELLKRLAREGVLLTVCPISNVTLRCVKEVKDVPIRKFLDAGVKFSINSDDPAYFGGHYLLDNYVAVQEAFDLSIQEWEGICRASIDGSWCSEERKQWMRTRLDEVIASATST